MGQASSRLELFGRGIRHRLVVSIIEMSVKAGRREESLANAEVASSHLSRFERFLHLRDCLVNHGGNLTVARIDHG
jgi:hypothetical protein